MPEPTRPQALSSQPGGEQKHEPSDVDVRGIVAIGSIIAIGVVLAAVLVAMLKAGLPAVREAAGVSEGPPPPPPQLQPHPRTDIVQLRAKKRAILQSYGWVDEPQGVVRIPIERAMALIAQRSTEPGQ